MHWNISYYLTMAACWWTLHNNTVSKSFFFGGEPCCLQLQSQDDWFNTSLNSWDFFSLSDQSNCLQTHSSKCVATFVLYEQSGNVQFRKKCCPLVRRVFCFGCYAHVVLTLPSVNTAPWDFNCRQYLQKGSANCLHHSKESCSLFKNIEGNQYFWCQKLLHAFRWYFWWYFRW